MKVYYGESNLGDTLSPIILEHFTSKKAEKAQEGDQGKLLMVGSFLDIVRDNDTLLGVGSNNPTTFLDRAGLRVLALRGPLTRSQLISQEVSETYGDPALLLPLIYQPKSIEKKREVGFIPHYIDQPLFENFIDITQGFQSFVDEVVSCESIVSSTLHGIVIAEAYGVPATWAVWSNKIAGGVFKYQDYFLGTDRGIQKPFKPLPPIENLSKIQSRLRNALAQL